MRISVIVALLLQFAAAFAQAQPARLKVGTIAPRGSIYHQLLLEAGETWKRAEEPGAVFTVFTDGSQGGEADLVRRVGALQMPGKLSTCPT